MVDGATVGVSLFKTNDYTTRHKMQRRGGLLSAAFCFRTKFEILLPLRFVVYFSCAVRVFRRLYVIFTGTALPFVKMHCSCAHE